MFDGIRQPGKATFVIGGQWGSEGKGAACAAIAAKLAQQGEAFDVITTNAGAQAGHTSVHNGETKVAFHLPTAALIASKAVYVAGVPRRLAAPLYVYLNAGSIIDPAVLLREIAESGLNEDRIFIHPNAAIITEECKEAEGRADSAQTKIASTRKGVGEALSRKVLRSGLIARDYAPLRKFVKALDLNWYLNIGMSVLVEVPQGISLSVDSQFYPYTTSRNCTVGQAMADAGVHPIFYGASVLVLRTFPIRVGNIVEDGKVLGHSGYWFGDQQETSWDDLGKQAEITTVTKRIRRVFTFSAEQADIAIRLTRPDIVYLTFCDYTKNGDNQLEEITAAIMKSALNVGMKPPTILYQYGPSTDDVFEAQRGEAA